ncbi:MAG: zinc ribbon domain-containing protein [Anaerolineales bacterium]|jgi:hypothetical protein
MSETTICKICGTEFASDANFCAQCGQKLKLSRDQVLDKVYQIVTKLTPIHLVVLGLLLLAILGGLSEYLLISKLSFGFSVLLMVLVISGGAAYSGWIIGSMSPVRKVVLRTLIVFACVGASLVVVLLLDRVLLQLLVGGEKMVFLRMRGVTVASAPGTRQATINNAPPYWLIVMVLAAVVFVIGNLAQRLRETISKNP